jgi:hypothetical protein
MTITTVSECWGKDYRRRVLFGTPARVHDRPEGRVCHFASGTIVAYEIVHGRRAYGCVFRASDVACDGLEVPGVAPAVCMLIPFCQGQRFGRALALLQELEQRGTLEALPDAALLRASVALGTPVSTHLLADAITLREDRPWIS